MKMLCKSEVKVYIFFLLFSIFALFFYSQDSYLYDLYNRVDSAWFFMCGKAWMNGMVPYVDFADSKGPLLWLIYGLGYLISPRDYIGVYWITCLWYSFIYYYTYKTADIFLKNRLKSVLCAVLMTVAFFNPLFHVETRAEDFCLLFVTLSLYRTCLLLYSDKVTDQIINRSFLLIGVSFACLFLIKFNIAAIQSILLITSCYYLYRSKLSFIKPLVNYMFGVLLVLVPFLIYFVVEGNLGAFIQEYLINTTKTVSGGGLYDYLIQWVHFWSVKKLLLLFLSLILGGYLLSRKLMKYKYFPLIVSILFFVMTFRHATWFLYYMNICSIFLIWVVLCFLWNKEIYKRTILICSVLTILPLFYHLYVQTYDGRWKPFKFIDVEQKAHFDIVCSIMKDYSHPTLINVMTYEFGYGILSESLPGCKYWAFQNGATESMIEEHKKDILKGVSDFLYVHDRKKIEKEGISFQLLKEVGYFPYYSYNNDNSYLFIKNTLLLK